MRPWSSHWTSLGFILVNYRVETLVYLFFFLTWYVQIKTRHSHKILWTIIKKKMIITSSCIARGGTKRCECVLVAQLCLTLCDLMDCSPPGSSVCGIPQATILEWVAMSSSRGSSPPRDQTNVSYISCIGRWVLYHWSTSGITGITTENY